MWLLGEVAISSLPFSQPRQVAMRRALLHCAVFALLALAAAELTEEDDSVPYDDEATGDEGFLDGTPQWREMVGRLQRSVDADGLLRARRWGNIANGALLGATGPIALVVSIFGLKLSNVVLSLYVTGVRTCPEATHCEKCPLCSRLRG